MSDSVEPRGKGEVHGWKEIAAYLDISVRKAQELEVEEELPVLRLGTGAKPRVYARVVELDFWKLSLTRRGTYPPPPDSADLPPEPARRRFSSRIAVWIVASFFCVGLSAYWLWERGRQPTSYKVTGRTLEVSDQRSVKIWQFELPETPFPEAPPETHYNAPKPLFADLNNDGINELLFPFSSQTHPGDWELMCFSSRGELLWKRRIGRELHTVQTDLTYPAVYDLKWVRRLQHPTPSGGVVVVGGSRGGSSLFCIEILTKEGHLVGDYYHPGWLWGAEIADLDSDGTDEIILGGVNNAYEDLPGFGYTMTLVVLDSRKVSGSGPAPSEDARHFAGLSEGNERAVLFLPDFGRMPSDQPDLFCLVDGIRAAGQYIEVHARRVNPGHSLLVEYLFDTHLTLHGLLPSPEVRALLKEQPAPGASNLERNKFYMQTLGNIRVLKNELAAK